MIFAKSHLDLHNIRASVQRTQKLSDNLVKIGPFGVGLDAITGFVPFIGPLYSGAAGAALIWEGIRARSSPMVLLEMSVLLVLDTVAPLIPTFGGIVDALFTGHKWAGDVLLKHMADTIYFEGNRADAMASAEYRDLMTRVRAGKETRRVVFLG
ncbi:MAG: hypothetical protein JWP35_2585 [Caulobacter sp.]|jgi:hypothetical protein|nr:hypothetical protein [Caulobacter sp.]